MWDTPGIVERVGVNNDMHNILPFYKLLMLLDIESEVILMAGSE